MTSTLAEKVSIKLTGKAYIVVDSSKRVSGTAENFIFTLPTLYQNVKSIKPVYIIISNNIYNITAVTNLLTIIRNTNPIQIGIPTGTYTTTTLITTMNTLWNPQNISFVYDPQTLKITISDTTSTPIQIDNLNSNILSVIGFNSSYNYASLQQAHQSNGVVSLDNSYDFINLNIDIVEQYYGNDIKNYLISFPISNIPFGKSDKVVFPDIEIVTKKSFFQQLEIQLTDKNFNQIDNNNADFLLLLQLQFLK